MAQERKDYVAIGQQSHMALRFRNYVPRDVALRRSCLPRPSVEELEKQIDREISGAIESVTKQDVVSQIAPRRRNWDLKRDVEKKLSILSRETDRAIVDLIRMKIAQSRTSKAPPKPPTGVEDERLTPHDREIGHSLINAMHDLEKVEEEDCD